MNKSETIKKVAGLSGVNEADSCKVMDALELVFQEELSQSRGWRYTLNKMSQLFAYLKKD